MLYLDIETTDLKANIGRLISWVAKDKETGEIYYDIINKDDIDDKGINDKRVVASLCKLLFKYDIIVTFFGSRFDIPFLRTRALKLHVTFPVYGQVLQIDIFYVARAKLLLSRKSLEAIGKYFGFGEKTPVEEQLWLDARYGNAKALSHILKHNIKDVELTESAHRILEPFIRGTRTSL